MKAAELLQELAAEGVTLTMKGGKLNFKAEREPLSAKRKAQIQALKPELMALLAGVGLTPSPVEADTKALEAELTAIVERWRKALEAERKGWASPAVADRSYQELVRMAAREAELREVLGDRAIGIPELASLELDEPEAEAKPNPLRKHLVQHGGWVAVQAERGEAAADFLHGLVIAWETATTDTERAKLSRMYKTAWKGDEPAQAA